MTNQIAVITVNFNNYQVTRDFIAYFKDCVNYKIFVSDLSSTRQELKTNSHIKINIADNKGYAYGVNLGLKNALEEGFTQFIVINNDTRVNSDIIEKVTNSLKKYPDSIIGGKIYYEAGFEYFKNKYQKNELGKVIWYAGGICDWNNALTKHRGVDEADTGIYNQPEKTDFITGCFMIFDKSVVDKVGYWDESYFLYYEDADYCERAKRNKIPLIYDPSLVIWHKNAQSTGGSGSQLHQKCQKKSRLKFGLKYAPLKTKAHLLINYLTTHELTLGDFTN